MNKIVYCLFIFICVAAAPAYALQSTDVLKVIYHVGPTVTLKTKADAGRLKFAEGSISLDGSHPIGLKLKSIKSVEWVTMPGTGHMVKVNSDPEIVYISVVRLNIGGYFLIVNLLKTRELFEFLQSGNPLPPGATPAPSMKRS